MVNNKRFLNVQPQQQNKDAKILLKKLQRLKISINKTIKLHIFHNKIKIKRIEIKINKLEIIR